MAILDALKGPSGIKLTDEPYGADMEKGIIYVSPSRKEFHPRFSEVPVERRRKAKAFEFIDNEDTYVQDLGMTSEKITLSLYFVGPHHHVESLDFQKAISERGPGTLELPFDSGRERKVIVLSYKKTNHFVDAINRTVFEVAFRETSEALAPNAETPDLSAVVANLSAQQALSEGLSLKGSIANAVGKVRGGVGAVTSKLQAGVQAVNVVKNKFESIATSIDLNASLLLEKPLIIASQIQSLASIPIFPRASELLSAYGDAIENFKNVPAIFVSGLKNSLLVDMVFGTALVSTLGVKVTQAQYASRDEAVEAFSAVQTIFEDYIENLIAQEKATAELPLEERFVVDPAVYESMYFLLQRITGNVDGILLGLQKEVTFVADQDISPLVIVAEHYPVLFAEDVNIALSLFENTNDLSADRIFLIAKGEEYKVMI